MAEQWRILVVESEENLNWNIVNSLQKDGYIVRGVTGGAEAIRLLWSEEYDLVICSQKMSDADGFDLLQWMRTYCPSTRMVMLGEAGKEMVRAQALEMGVVAYLEKPLDMHALKEELRRLLHQTGFSASLDSFDLLDVIQIITMSRKSIALVVSTGLEEQGILRFQNGELIWAEYGTLRGEEAFFALAAHKNGTVVHRPWNDQIAPNVMQPLSRLIFQALQYRSKYADSQQLSSAMEAIRPGGSAPGPSISLSPVPSTSLPAALQGMEDDDRPFQFVAEDLLVEHPSSGLAFEQVMHGGPAVGGPLDQAGGMPGGFMQTEPAPGSREWWEASGSLKVQRPGDLLIQGGEGIGQAFPGGGVNITPATVHKTAASQGNALPSWLTDQPTHLDLPVLRGNTGQMPLAVPPLVPNNSQPLPPPSSQPGQFGGEWPIMPPPMAALNPSESGLRKIKPDEALFTGHQQAIKPQTSGPLRQAPAEWQTPQPGPMSEHSGYGGAIRPPNSQERVGEPLQSLAALQRNNSSPQLDGYQLTNGMGAGVLPDAHPLTNGAGAAAYSDPQRVPNGMGALLDGYPSMNGVGAAPYADPRPAPNGMGAGAAPPKPAQKTNAQQVKRNYPALVAALQTLGYSVSGFVASAVVGMDGTPIAQVAVDELDISQMCEHFSHIVQGAIQALAQGYWDRYEHTIITSTTQHILLRMIGEKKDIFQVLITTRDANPAESLDVMANVSAALASAL